MTQMNTAVMIYGYMDGEDMRAEMKDPKDNQVETGGVSPSVGCHCHICVS